LLRLGAAGTVVMTLVAIALGRHAPPTGTRRLRDDLPVPVSGHLFPDQQSRFFDPRTGRLVSLDLPDRPVHYMSVSPWDDGHGAMQVVGQVGSELVRFATPGGRVLDRVPVSPNLTCPPCWYPGTSARVLLATWDRGLYEYNFDEAETARSPRGLREVPWRVGRPPGAVPTDLSWARDQRLRGCLLAAVWTSGENEPLVRLWWLRLDGDGRSVVAAGPLMPRDTGGAMGPAERAPVWGRAADGTAWLAYLACGDARGNDPCQLRVAPASIDAATGAPRAERSASRLLVEGCLRVPPAFLPGGSSLSYPSPRAEGLLRVPLVDTGLRRVMAMGPISTSLMPTMAGITPLLILRSAQDESGSEAVAHP
jgi:hypothetical protein